MNEMPREDGIADFRDELAAGADVYAQALTRSGEQEAGTPGPTPGLGMAAVLKIPVQAKVVLGSAMLSVAAIGRLAPGNLVPLDRTLGEPVDLVVNGQIVARGEVVVTDEATARFALTIVEVCGG